MRVAANNTVSADVKVMSGAGDGWMKKIVWGGLLGVRCELHVCLPHLLTRTDPSAQM